jgi:6,7-dimethyl-8-ribityllumazine synthase
MVAKTVEGKLSAAQYRFGIIVSRFNEFITRRLLDSALDCLSRHSAKEKSIKVVYCPGAYEIPQVAQKLASTGSFHAIICLGCIIRGETPHFEYIANAVSVGVNRASVESHVPMVFSVLTTDSLEQAIERAGGKAGNKGWEAALVAIEMADLQTRMQVQRKS